MRQLERNVLLNVIDRKWREHLYEMDYLKEGIGLRAMAQRDPLVEYQREGYDMFIGMLDGAEGGVGRLPVQRHRRGGARRACSRRWRPSPRRPGSPNSPQQAAAQAQEGRRRDRGTSRKHRPCAPRESTTTRHR